MRLYVDFYSRLLYTYMGGKTITRGRFIMSDSTILTSVFAAIGAYLVLIITGAIFIVVCNWFIFVKAREPGWKCLIPIYGSFIDYQISWKGGVFIISLVLSVLASFINNRPILIILSVIQLLLYLGKQMKLGARFGKSGAFSFFLLFLIPFIGYPILAFSSAKYDASLSP